MDLSPDLRAGRPLRPLLTTIGLRDNKKSIDIGRNIDTESPKLDRVSVLISLPLNTGLEPPHGTVRSTHPMDTSVTQPMCGIRERVQNALLNHGQIIWVHVFSEKIRFPKPLYTRIS